MAQRINNEDIITVRLTAATKQRICKNPGTIPRMPEFVIGYAMVNFGPNNELAIQVDTDTVMEFPGMLKTFTVPLADVTSVQPSGDIYSFRHITDLLMVPPERRETCLREMVQALATIGLAITAARIEGDTRDVSNMVPYIRWVDNGDVNTVVQVQNGGTIVVHLNDVTKA